MYVYDQGGIIGVPPGIGRLDSFCKAPERVRVKVERSTFTPNEALSLNYAEEMRRLADKARRVEENSGNQAARGLWNGVDDYYSKWSKVKYVTLGDESWRIYKLAAYAAEQRGDAASRYSRLQSAIASYPPSEPAEEAAKLRSEINDLDVNWANVEIRLIPKSAKDLELVGEPESRPDQMAAIEWAREKLRGERKFTGLLPLGLYRIDGQNIPLDKRMARSLVFLVRIRQKMDGSFDTSQPVPFQRPRDLRDKKNVLPRKSSG